MFERARKGTYEFEEELLNVERGEQLALSVDDDLARRLAWNRLEWLHNLDKTRTNTKVISWAHRN